MAQIIGKLSKLLAERREMTERRFEWDADSFDPQEGFALILSLNAKPFLGKPAEYWFCLGVDGEQFTVEGDPEIAPSGHVYRRLKPRWRFTLRLGLASDDYWQLAGGARPALDWSTVVPEAELIEVVGCT